MPKRHLLVAFGPRQTSQQSTTRFNYQDGHIPTSKKEILQVLRWKVFKDHGTYEQNSLLRRPPLSQKITAFVFELKTMER